MSGKKKTVLKEILKPLFLLSILAILLFWKDGLYSRVFHDDSKAEDSGEAPLTPVISAVPVQAGTKSVNEILPAADSLVSKNAILVSLDNEDILYEKNSDETIYPASLTKIMTAILALEKVEDLKQPIRLSPDIFDALYEENASMAGFLPGEKVSAIDLLYGALLPSGAECCIGLAEYIAGSEDAFVDLMNEKAKALGMEDTHFTNTTGLHSPDHYSTVSDLAVLLEYCLKNDIFREIFTSKSHSTAPSKLHPDGITFYSTLFKSMDSIGNKDDFILGGKTGYTGEAGLCLASLAKINGKEYILVTAHADGDHLTEQYNITDALYLYSRLE